MAAQEQGRELTARALVAGAFLGALLAVANVYMGLKTGWGDSGNITSALLGFAVFSALRRLGSRPYSLLENNITQTTASSAAGMTFATGLIGAFPALAMLGHRYPFWAISLWGVALSAIGVGLGVLLREQLIVADALPFPSGIATAELMKAIHRSGSSAIRQARVLLISAIGAISVAWFRDGRPAWIPQSSAFPVRLSGATAESLTLGISWSPLMFGTGLLIGPRNGLSLLAGGLISWAGFAPLALRSGWVQKAEYFEFASWLLWPGVTLIACAALTSLAFQWRTLSRGIRDLGRVSRAARSDHRGVPQLSLWALLAAGVVLTLLIGWIAFGLRPVPVLAVLVLSILLSTMCARATGETDVAPITQMGQLTQISAGAAGVSQVSANILSASIVSGNSTQTSMMLWAFKTGHLLGASQRKQVWAQLCGAVVGALAVVPAYQLVSRAYPLGTQALPAPVAQSWKAIAGLVHAGFAAIPESARFAAVACGVAGVVLASLDRTSLSRFIPSPVAMGVGFLAPASLAVAVALGSLSLVVARRLRPAGADEYAASIASGAIAGESLLGVLVAALLATGVLQPS